MPNKLTELARGILAVEADLPYRIDRERERATVEDYEFHVFPQVWGSTALGFGGIGGQAMTTAYTVVCVPLCDQKCHVYFGGRYAYSEEPSQAFMEDVYHQNMEPVYRAGKYVKAAEKAEMELKSKKGADGNV